ncbi:hypothetical protein JHK82_033812 [Glycine max]|uniref:Uncharacterized protein n=2 Tax=Glycine subgen. Soja TaxID=1462606 RepID=A0A0R0H5U6_SOYBN|nr:hypothetical protein JHK87_033755 [Glycine soja]KAG4980571.1 hypothetical protein JHK85_034529 [Glycine max]KAG4986203.1 hypothetical protein JHK86_033894 [Glycine max]KAG5119392.1 hypothetical protein JHK82_033812 [Glycine max]KAG5140383.1 hypothetical protein JHK84_034151 [Glycine max]
MTKTFLDRLLGSIQASFLLPSFISCSFFTTRFPEFKSCVIGLFTTQLDKLLNLQIVLLVSLGITRSPLSSTTQTMIEVDIFLYHIPKYLPIEVLGLKKSTSKVPSSETNVSPSRIN